MSRAALNIRRRVEEMAYMASLVGDQDGVWELRNVLRIIDEEIEAEAERQFTRPISQQAELSKNLKESK